MVLKFNDAETVLTADGVIGKKRAARPGCEIVQIRVEAGKKVPSHEMSVPTTFIVTYGTVEANIGKEHLILERGDIVEVEANVPREWINNTDDFFEITTIKYMPK